LDVFTKAIGFSAVSLYRFLNSVLLAGQLSLFLFSYFYQSCPVSAMVQKRRNGFGVLFKDCPDSAPLGPFVE
jgi:hypothetical protein